MLLADTILRFTTDARTYARKFGMIKFLSSIRSIFNRIRGQNGYEISFDDAMKNEIRIGDVVWDIGANLGLYTKVFSHAVGEKGCVLAFEPVPSCFSELKSRCSSCENVRFFNMAIGENETKLKMSIAEDPLGATHSLVSSGNTNQPEIEVTVNSGDYLIEKEKLHCPNVIKIDVEGYEEEVLKGLSKTLFRSECRAVFCEIHFTLLDQRGERYAPVRIQKLLKNAGFNAKWTDASHLAAYKN